MSFIKIKGQPMGRQVCLTMPIKAQTQNYMALNKSW